MMIKKFILILSGIIAILVLHPFHAYAFYQGSYDITNSDTPNIIDTTNTTALVDTTNYKITLAQVPMADQLSVWPGRKDLLVMTNGGVDELSFAGTSYIKNPIISVTSVSNPTAMAAASPFPDVTIADYNGVEHYSFDGNGMLLNPFLTISGMTNIVSVSNGGSNSISDLATVDSSSNLKHYSLSSNSYLENSFLELPSQIKNIVDISLFPSNNDLAVLTPNKLYFYNFNGTSLVENPMLDITGLSNASAMSVTNQNNGYEASVIEGSKEVDYMFNGSQMVQNNVLSINSGLADPTSVAIIPGTEDRVIIDDGAPQGSPNILYYQYNNGSFTLNTQLSYYESNLEKPKYQNSDVAQSLVFTSSDPVDDVMRVLAYINAPTSTEVDVFGSVDGVNNFIELYKVIGNSSGGELYVTYNNGSSFEDLGTSSIAYPINYTYTPGDKSKNMQLWINMPQGVSGNSIVWKFVLSTSDQTVTPVIQVQSPNTPGQYPAIIWQVDESPSPPVIIISGTCYTTTTPTISWSEQGLPGNPTDWSFDLTIGSTTNTNFTYDFGIMSFSNSSVSVSGDTTSFTLPDTSTLTTPDMLWQSGGYQFYAQVRVYNDQGIPSILSNQGDFCVVAFDNPRISKIVYPGGTQVAPDPSNQNTWISITEGESSSDLPVTQAGGDVQLVLDYIGPANPTLNFSFPYPEPNTSQNASIYSGEPTPAGSIANFAGGSPYDGYVGWSNGTNNVYVVDFYTNPELTVTPTGTVVGLEANASGSGGVTSFNLPPWAAGVVTTNGSILSHIEVIIGNSTGR